MKKNLLLAAVLLLVGVNGLSAMKRGFREESWKRVQDRGPITPGGPCLGKECRCRAHENADAQVQQPAAQQKNAQQLAAQKLAAQQLAAQQLEGYRKERQQKNRQRRKNRQQKNKQNSIS